MAAQTQERSESVISYKEQLADNLVETIGSHPEVLTFKTFPQFKAWQETHADVPLSYWHYFLTAYSTGLLSLAQKRAEEHKNEAKKEALATAQAEEITAQNASESVANTRVTADESAQATTSGRDAQSEAASSDIQNETLPRGEAMQSGEITRTADGLVQPMTAEAQQNKAPYVSNLRPISKTSPSGDEKPPASPYSSLLKPQSERFQVQKKEYYQSLLKKNNLRRQIPVIHVTIQKSKPQEEEKPLQQSWSEELQFSLLSPASQERVRKERERDEAQNKLLKATGLSAKSESSDERQTEFTESTGSKDLPDEENEQTSTGNLTDIQPHFQDIDETAATTSEQSDLPKKEFALEIAPGEENKIYLNPTADPVYRLFDQTAHSEAIRAYNETHDVEKFHEQLLLWKLAFARDFATKARAYAPDDKILTYSYQTIYLSYVTESTTTATTTVHASTTSTIMQPGSSGGSVIMTPGENEEGKHTRTNHPTHPMETIRRPMPSTDNKPSGESGISQEENANNEDGKEGENKRGRRHRKKRRSALKDAKKAKKYAERFIKTIRRIQAAVDFFAANWEWLVPAIVILCFFLVILAVVINKKMDDKKAATGGDTTIPVTVDKQQAADQESKGIENDKLATYSFTITYPGKATDIVITDQLSDNAEPVQTGSTAFTYEASTHVVTWHAKDILAGSLVSSGSASLLDNPKLPITLVVKSNQHDTYIFDQATATVLGVPASGGPAGSIINTQAQSLEDTFKDASQKSNVPVNVLKAIAKTESSVLKYTEDDVATFSKPQWWAGLVDNASSVGGNDPLIVKGYGYNTCQYTSCFSGADVRGAMQFELKTWNNLKKSLSFADQHDPDRRYVKDIVYGAAQFIRNVANQYDTRFGFSKNTDPNVWTEAQVRAVATTYCAGNPDGNSHDAACSQGGKGYDDIAWGYYKALQGIQ